MNRFITIVLFLLIFCEGCEKIFDFPEKRKYEKVPVIEALFTSKPDHQKVRVSFSTQFEDSLSCVPFPDALVNITDLTGHTVIFQYSGDGWYTSNNIIALPEKQYTLSVQIDSTIYQATSRMVAVNGIDSLTYSFHKSLSNQDSAYFLKIYAGISDPDNPKYYQLQMYRNKQLITEGGNIILFSDIATLSLNGIELSNRFSKSDTLDLELYSLTREMYNYYLYIFNNVLYNNNNDLDFKNNPTIQFTPMALGYFQISSLSCKSIIIK